MPPRAAASCGQLFANEQEAGESARKNCSTRTKWERAQIQKIFLSAEKGQNRDEIIETNHHRKRRDFTVRMRNIIILKIISIDRNVPGDQNKWTNPRVHKLVVMRAKPFPGG